MFFGKILICERAPRLTGYLTLKAAPEPRSVWHQSLRTIAEGACGYTLSDQVGKSDLRHCHIHNRLFDLVSTTAPREPPFQQPAPEAALRYHPNSLQQSLVYPGWSQLYLSFSHERSSIIGSTTCGTTTSARSLRDVGYLCAATTAAVCLEPMKTSPIQNSTHDIMHLRNN